MLSLAGLSGTAAFPLADLGLHFVQELAVEAVGGLVGHNVPLRQPTPARPGQQRQVALRAGWGGAKGRAEFEGGGGEDREGQVTLFVGIGAEAGGTGGGGGQGGKEGVSRTG